MTLLPLLSGSTWRDVDAPFTQLSPAALPGKRYSFSPKTAAGAGPHTGLFTELSVIALPGQRHSFLAKTAAEIVTPEPEPPPIVSIGGGGGMLADWPERRDGRDWLRKRREQQELDEFVKYILPGVLNLLGDN